MRKILMLTLATGLLLTAPARAVWRPAAMLFAGLETAHGSVDFGTFEYHGSLSFVVQNGPSVNNAADSGGFVQVFSLVQHYWDFPSWQGVETVPLAGSGVVVAPDGKSVEIEFATPHLGVIDIHVATQTDPIPWGDAGEDTAIYQSDLGLISCWDAEILYAGGVNSATSDSHSQNQTITGTVDSQPVNSDADSFWEADWGSHATGHTTTDVCGVPLISVASLAGRGASSGTYAPRVRGDTQQHVVPGIVFKRLSIDISALSRPPVVPTA